MSRSEKIALATLQLNSAVARLKASVSHSESIRLANLVVRLRRELKRLMVA